MPSPGCSARRPGRRASAKSRYAERGLRGMRGGDAQIFAGYRDHEGLLDDRPLAAAEVAVKAAAATGGASVGTAAGVSGGPLPCNEWAGVQLRPGTLVYVHAVGNATLLAPTDAEAAAVTPRRLLARSSGDSKVGFFLREIG